jgi:uncharacterized protein with GYD domain
MAAYLVQVAYTPEAWATMMKNPQNRQEAIAPVVERLGGRLEALWLAFGEYDTVAIVQMPDNVSAAAFGIAASGGGAVKAFKTTPLMSPQEGVEAMRKAGGAGYRPPGG